MLERFLNAFGFAKDREKAAGRLSLFGVGLNGILFISKAVTGYLSGSAAFLADAFNNLADGLSNVTLYLGMRVARKAPDHDHPYGHGRAEYLATLGIGVFILFTAWELFWSALRKVFHPVPVSFSWAALVVLLLAIVIKAGMAVMYHEAGNKIQSSALLAAAQDSRNDVLASATVFLSFLWPACDGYLGAGLAVVIALSGLGIIRDALTLILGKRADADLVNQITALVLDHPLILGVHDVMVHDYGVENRFVTLHVETSTNIDAVTAHEVIDHIEREIANKFHMQATIHLDPIVTDDKQDHLIYQKVAGLLKGLDEEATIHDFRVARHPETVIAFDIFTRKDLDLSVFYDEFKDAELYITIDKNTL